MILNISFLFFILSNFLISSYPALGSYEYNQAHNTYVVHMDSTKMKALDASLGPSRRWHEEIIESISVSDQDDDDDQRQYSPLPQLHYVYDTIMTGFSAKLSEQHLESLKEVDGFVYATRDEFRTLHTTHSPQFLGLHVGQGLWSAKNLASDVIIGVLDTGIWPEHPSFRDWGLPPVPSRWKGECQAGTNFTASNCNRKLIGAAAFFKGYESKRGRINETLDYRSARDSNGHGTHTASTAGGNPVGGANIFGRAYGTAAGMRYTARIAAYKVCYKYPEDICYNSDILAAMDRAVEDGVDILSISLGAKALPYYDDDFVIGAFGAMRKGVIVSTVAGNSGPTSSTVDNVAPWLMTVGASTTDRSFLAQVRLGDGKIFSGASLFSGNFPKPLPLAYNETGDAKFCRNGSLSPSLVKGKIVICVGSEELFDNDQVVKAAGGAGIILAIELDKGEDNFAWPYVLPAVTLGASAANAVINYTKSSKNPTVMFKFLGDVYGNPAPVMAAFSSRGPNSVDPNILKPDVTAPGVNILAAWPPNISPTQLKEDKRRVLFNIVSGTSMSCPHVSGLIALLKSLHRHWSPAALKSALMTTANVHDSRNSPISDAVFNDSKPATPFAFGSGHVNPERASDPGLIYDISTQDYLDYLCSLNYNSTQMAPFADNFTTCPANTSHLRPGDLNYPSFSVIFSGDFTATTYKRTVTNVGIAVSNYSVKVIEPKGVSVTVQPKVLKFEKMGEKKSYYVTFNAKRGGMPTTTNATFGSLEWVSDGKYSVRSPIAVIWLST